MEVWTYFASIHPHFLTFIPESRKRIRYYSGTGVEIMNWHGVLLSATIANEKLRGRNSGRVNGIYVPKRPIRRRHSEGLENFVRFLGFLLGFPLKKRPNSLFERGPLLPGSLTQSGEHLLVDVGKMKLSHGTKEGGEKEPPSFNDPASSPVSPGGLVDVPGPHGRGGARDTLPPRPHELDSGPFNPSSVRSHFNTVS